MSNDWMDAARDDFIDEISEQAGKEAVENFTAARLCSFYDKELAVAEKPFNALTVARQIFQTPYHTASFIHAAIASEVMLKGVILKPIIHGFIHNDSIAPFIVELAFGSSGLDRTKKLLAKIFQDVCSVDLMTYRGTSGGKTLWEEIIEVQKRRDHIMHRAEATTKAEAERAIAVATVLTEEIFPVFAKSLGYHLRDGFRLCSDYKCAWPEAIRKMVEQTQPTG